MNRKEADTSHAKHSASSQKAVKRGSPNTGMRLWMVTLRDPRKHRERKVWVTEIIALATSSRGAVLVTQREFPALFAYNPHVHVEALPHHTVKHLTYQAEPRKGE